MARFLVKASEFKNVCKAVNDRQLESLKKEIIEILKKQDEKDVKKAIDYFNSQEGHYTHLEKSLISGKWIQKAGYGVGTVRIWKGKKYKKIAPGKWARVFDKEGRGTNIAIGKLIARVQKIDNVEDLMAFVMQNKQRFVDENGIDLPVLDKLRAAVDAKNNGDMGSKTTSKPAEKKTVQGVKILSKNEIHNLTKGEVQDYRKELHDAMKKLDYGADDFDILYATKKIADDTWHNKEYKDAVDSDKNIKEFAAFLKENNLHQHDKIEYKGKEYIVQYDSQGGDGDLLWIPPVFDDSDFDVSEIKIKTEEKSDEKEYDSELVDSWKEDYKDFSTDKLKEKIDEYTKVLERAKNDNPSPDQRVAVKQNEHRLKALNDLLAEKKEKPVEEPKKTPKEEKTEKIYSVDNSGKVVSFDELQPIASNKSVGENEVQLPYSKDLANEIESLKDCVVPKWDNREFMKHVYYEDGKLITTDARRMKFIEVGELEGIPDGSYVDITTDKSGINIKKIDLDARFPNYKKVIPDNLNQSATLDTKLVKDKIKEMQKDGAISRKGSNIVQLEFRDGKVFIDDTAVGEAKDIKMKYGEGWGPARNDTNYMAINADYLVNALSGKTSVIQIGERADKAIAINTGSTSNILMPMSGSDKKMDYGQGRQAKKDANDKKAEERKKNKDYNFELLKDIREGKLTSSQVEKVAESIDDRLSSFTDEELQREWARLNYDIDKGFEKKALKSVNDIIDNKLHLSGYAAIAYSVLKERHPEIREKLATELEKRGISVKKSLFDDFVMDMFIDEDEEEIEEDKENESLFNDYSAEQPDLFNSTEMKVEEAFNRCGCCL